MNNKKTPWPSCTPDGPLNEEHILAYWDYYELLTRTENDLHKKHFGKANWTDIERAKSIGRKGGQGHDTKGKYYEASKKKRKPRTPTFNQYVTNV